MRIIWALYKLKLFVKDYFEIETIIKEVKKAVVGKDDCIHKLLIAILTKGHVLINDIPGVGKTTLALAFSKALDLKANRMQFTPDVLPSDVIGFYMYKQDIQEFVYQPGPIMCNLFLADEINRTSPKTQSALLEVMEEGGVTIDGYTNQVPEPFIVIATQNPVGSAGTQMLPESQLDRFMISISLGYPGLRDEIYMIKDRSKENPLERINPVIGSKQLIKMQKQVDEVYIHNAVYEYIVKLSAKTREHDMIQFGVSPRGTLALSRMAKGNAFIKGRDYVLPDDVTDIFSEVVWHRLVLSPKAKLNYLTKTDIINDILKAVNKPTPKGKL